MSTEYFHGFRVYGSSPKVRCDKCGGTGVNIKATEDINNHRSISEHVQIRCMACNGNGLDPASFFDWKTK